MQIEIFKDKAKIEDNNTGLLSNKKLILDQIYTFKDGDQDDTVGYIQRSTGNLFQW